MDFSELTGKTLVSVGGRVDDDVMVFTTDTGDVYKLFHSQDCCEEVRIEDICGDINAIIGHPIVEAYEQSNYEGPSRAGGSDSWTWTFYVLRTMKDTVTIRWLGESNGYYSERVDFLMIEKP